MTSPELIASLRRGSEIIINAGLYDEHNNPLDTYRKRSVVIERRTDGVEAATVLEGEQGERLSSPGGFPFDIIAEATGRVWSEKEIQQGFAWIFDP